MSEQTRNPESLEARNTKALENMQRDIRGAYLLLQIWFTLFVIGAIVFAIAAMNS